MTQIAIPPPREAPTRRNPQVLVLIGQWQIGKTTSVAALPDTLILELQPGGVDYVPRCWAITVEKELQDWQSFVAVIEHLGKERLAGRPVAKRLCIDHLGLLSELNDKMTLDKFNASPVGRSYLLNHPNEPLAEITDLPGPSGSRGWGYLREELAMLARKILMAAPEIIYIGHPRLTRVTKVYGDVMIEDVDLLGAKARQMFCRESSAVAWCRRERKGQEDQFIVSFKTSELALQASRCPHLSGREFVVGKSIAGQPPQFDWSQIYIDDFAAPTV